MGISDHRAAPGTRILAALGYGIRHPDSNSCPESGQVTRPREIGRPCPPPQSRPRRLRNRQTAASGTGEFAAKREEHRRPFRPGGPSSSARWPSQTGNVRVVKHHGVGGRHTRPAKRPVQPVPQLHRHQRVHPQVEEPDRGRRRLGQPQHSLHLLLEEREYQDYPRGPAERNGRASGTDVFGRSRQHPVALSNPVEDSKVFQEGRTVIRLPLRRPASPLTSPPRWCCPGDTSFSSALMPC